MHHEKSLADQVTSIFDRDFELEKTEMIVKMVATV